VLERAHYAFSLHRYAQVQFHAKNNPKVQRSLLAPLALISIYSTNMCNNISLTLFRIAFNPSMTLRYAFPFACKRTISYTKQIEDNHKNTLAVDVDGSSMMVTFDVYDTAGREEYSAMRDQYIRNAQSFLVCYAITNRRSFEEVGEFREQILRVQDRDNFPMVLVGNKCDLADSREVI